MATSFAFKPIVTDGLVLYLDASNTKSYSGMGSVWYDLSRENNSTILGPTFSSENGGLFNFDGVNDYISFQPLSSNLTTNNLSFEWILKYTPNGNFQNIFACGNTTTFDIYIIPDGNLRVYSSSNFDSTNINLLSNILYFITITTTNSSVCFYINGNLIQEIPATISTASNFPDPKIGYNLSLYPLNANLYQFKCYNRKITSEEVLQNYNALKNRFI